MSISKILKDKNLSNSEKLKKIGEIVNKTRETYGNKDMKISVPEISTVNGELPLTMLSEDTKLYLVESEVAKLRVQAHEFTQMNEGTVLAKYVEALIATNPVLTNVEDSVDFGNL